MRVQRGCSQAVSSGAQWQDQRQWAQTETQEVPSQYQKTLIRCEDDWALAQVAQRGCRVYVPQDIQKPSGHGPGQPAPGNRVTGCGDLPRSLPTSATLWFCDSVISTKHSVFTYLYRKWSVRKELQQVSETKYFLQLRPFYNEESIF